MPLGRIIFIFLTLSMFCSTAIGDGNQVIEGITTGNVPVYECIGEYPATIETTPLITTKTAQTSSLAFKKSDVTMGADEWLSLDSSSTPASIPHKVVISKEVD